MATLDELRALHPDLNDDQIADLLHQRNYPDLPKSVVRSAMGLDVAPESSRRPEMFDVPRTQAELERTNPADQIRRAPNVPRNPGGAPDAAPPSMTAPAAPPSPMAPPRINPLDALAALAPQVQGAPPAGPRVDTTDDARAARRFVPPGQVGMVDAPQIPAPNTPDVSGGPSVLDALAALAPQIDPARVRPDPGPRNIMPPMEVAPRGPVPVPPSAFQSPSNPLPTPAQPVDPVQQLADIADPNNPAGVGLSRALQRGVLRTRSTFPAMGAAQAAGTIEEAATGFASEGGRLQRAQQIREQIAAYEVELPALAAADPDAAQQLRDEIGLMRQQADQLEIGATTRSTGQYQERMDAAAGEAAVAGTDALMRMRDFSARAQAIPFSPAAQRAQQNLAEAPDTVMGTIRALSKDPLATGAFLGEIAAESGPQLAASAATAIISRNPALAAGILGAGTMTQEYGASVDEFLAENGVVIDSPEAAAAALRDSRLMNDAEQRGLRRGVVIAAAEMLGQGLTTAATRGMRPVTEAVTGVGIQAATGGSGEAAARLAAGQDMSAQEIILEAVAEMVTAPIEIGIAASAPQAAPTEGTAPEQPPEPYRTTNDQRTDRPRQTIPAVPAPAPDRPRAPAEDAAPVVPTPRPSRPPLDETPVAPQADTPERLNEPVDGAGQDGARVSAPTETDGAPDAAAPSTPSPQQTTPPVREADWQALPIRDAQGNIDETRTMMENRRTGEVITPEAYQQRLDAQRAQEDGEPAVPTATSPQVQAGQERQTPVPATPRQADPVPPETPDAMPRQPAPPPEPELPTNEDMPAAPVAEPGSDPFAPEGDTPPAATFGERWDGMTPDQRFDLFRAAAPTGREDTQRRYAERDWADISDRVRAGIERQLMAEDPQTPATAPQVDTAPAAQQDAQTNLPVGPEAAPATPDAASSLPRNTPAAERPFPDFSGQTINGYDDNTSEDGRNSPSKKAFHSAGKSFFNATAKILKDAGWTPVTYARGRNAGKPIKAVASNWGGVAGSGEVTLVAAGPNSLRGVYAQLGDSAMTGKRGGVRMMYRIMQNDNPYSTGMNEFIDPTGLTPAEFAQTIMDKHSAIQPRPKAEVDTAPPAADAEASDGTAVPSSDLSQTPAGDGQPDPAVSSPQKPEVDEPAPESDGAGAASREESGGADEPQVPQTVEAGSDGEVAGEPASPSGSRPTYIYRKVLNYNEIRAWASDQGFETTLPPEELHVTQVYAKEPVDRGQRALQPRKDQIEAMGGRRSVERLGDQGAIVLRFASTDLSVRWNELKDAGAKSDFPSYKAHVTISYDKGVDLDAVNPYTGPIVLGPEIVEDITGDFDPTSIKEVPTADQGEPTIMLARELVSLIAADNMPKTSAALMKLAAKHFGGTVAEGKFSPKDAYEAAELALNMTVQRLNRQEGIYDPAAADADMAKAQVEGLQELLDSFPTQTRRDAETDAFQQFSTPPTYAFAANWVANIKEGDKVLEPSAGNGGIATFAKTAGAKVDVNELSKRRLPSLEALGFERVTSEDAEQIGNIWASDKTRRYDVVVMNPPFSAAGGRTTKKTSATGAKHIEAALDLLQPGGRLVAIMGHTFRPTNSRVTPFFRRIAKDYTVRANIEVDGKKIYRKYGTGYDNRILVIDKVAPPDGHETMTGRAETIPDLIDMLTEVRDVADDRSPAPDRGAEDAGQRAGEEGSAPVADGREPGAGERESDTQPDDLGGEGDGGARSGRPASEDGGAKRDAGDAEPGAREGGSGNADERRSPGGRGPALAGDADKALRLKEAEESQVEEAGGGFAKYRPTRVRLEGAKEHPMLLVESSAMATVNPPKPDYQIKLPRKMVTDGLLSEAQLEQVIYAGAAHQEMLPPVEADGPERRKGYYIGDGTGVGKTREIAGIIADNWAQDRKQHILISKDKKLLSGARRDFDNVGMRSVPITDLGSVKATGQIEKGTQGVMFATYSTLAKKPADGKDSRVDQLVNWLGADFDGTITFDEAHLAGNAIEVKSTRGKSKPSAAALAVIELQARLPNARVVYASATAATEVYNLAYADRLGLWGPGTPFPNVHAFVNQIEAGGIAAMEVVARDMKQMGVYMARGLSYEGVEYAKVEHALTADQQKMYNAAAEAWQGILSNIGEVIEEYTGGGGRQRGTALAQFWSTHQRFFGQVLTSMQMPSIIKSIEADLKSGMAPVIQIVNTNEAATKRAISKLDDSQTLDDIDITPRQDLIQYLENSFPVVQFETYTDDSGNEQTRPAKDSKGNVILNAKAVEVRDRLVAEVASMQLPGNPLDMIIDTFGADKVAEITGRTNRIVTKDGKKKTERRTQRKALGEAAEFQAGKRDVLVFSDAGGTGMDFHADKGAKNQKRRAHYILQAGWRADRAIQGFGRTHRTNQAQPPIYKLAGTNLSGHKRFTSSIARRLDQLGALTKGQKDAGGGMFDATDNLENEFAEAAVISLFSDIAAGRVPGMDMADVKKELGLDLQGERGFKATAVPSVPQFLNRLLNVTIEKQNMLFDAFMDHMQNAVQLAMDSGQFTAGVEEVKHAGAVQKEVKEAYRDPVTGATSEYRQIELTQKTTLVPFNAVNQYSNVIWKESRNTGEVYGFRPASSRTRDDGTVIPTYHRHSVADRTMIDSDDYRMNYKQVTAEEAEAAWQKQIAEAPTVRKETLHMVTGALLPIWDRLSNATPRIKRLKLDDGRSLLGREISDLELDSTLQKLGVDMPSIDMTPAEIQSAVMEGKTIMLSSGHRIERRRVGGENRIEVISPPDKAYSDTGYGGLFSKLGIQIERIDYRNRAFVPTGEAGTEPLARFMTGKNIVNVTTRKQSRPAEEIAAGGALSGRQRKILTAVRDNPGATIAEIGEAAGIPSAHGTRVAISHGNQKLRTHGWEIVSPDQGQRYAMRPVSPGVVAAQGLPVPGAATYAKRNRMPKTQALIFDTVMQKPGITRAGIIESIYEGEPPKSAENAVKVQINRINEAIKPTGFRLVGIKGRGYFFVPEGEGRAAAMLAIGRGMAPLQKQARLDFYYSPMLRGIEAAKQRQAPAGDWKAIIAKMPEVKRAEIEWSGVEEWLDSLGNVQVTREDLADFMRGSQIEIVEEVGADIEEPDIRVEIGDPVEPDWDEEADLYMDEARDELESEIDEDDDPADIDDDEVLERAKELAYRAWKPTQYYASAYDANGDWSADGYYDSEDRTYSFEGIPYTGLSEQGVVEAAEEEIASGAGGSFKARHEQYTEDGGTNYREIVLTMPDLHKHPRNAQGWEVGPDGIGRETKPGARPFVQSAHFEQENIVVHARVKDRRGPNGERVLFVEEIQSDLASKWREATESPEITARRRELQKQRDAAQREYEAARDAAIPEVKKLFTSRMGDTGEAVASGIDALDMNHVLMGGEGGTSGAIRAVMKGQNTPLYDEAQAKLSAMEALHDEILRLGTERTLDPSLPDTPFKEEHTYNLMVKRLLRMAAEEGYDRLAWTPGYMQAERWDKAAQSVVEEVSWFAVEDGDPRRVSLMMGQNGQIDVMVSTNGIITGPPADGQGRRQATTLTGKPLSSLIGQKIADQVIASPDGVVSGQKITFPDSGYAIAYDQQTRKAVDKFAKRYGAKVELKKDMPAARPVWSVDITDSLREAAMKPMPVLREAAMKPVKMFGDRWERLDLFLRLRQQLDRLGLKDVDLKFDPTVAHQGEAIADHWGKMTIILGQTGKPDWTLGHEAIHIYRHLGVISADEWAMLEREARRRGWVDAYDIDLRYPDLTTEERLEEAIAEAFGEWFRSKGGVQHETAVQAAFRKIANFVKAIRDWMSGAGMESYADVFDAITRGEFAKRGRKAPGWRSQTERLMKQSRHHPPHRTVQGHMAMPDRRVWATLFGEHAGMLERMRQTKGAVGDRFGLTRTRVQDYMYPFLRAQRMLERQYGQALPDDINAYLAEEGYTSRAWQKQKMVDETYVQPILNLMAKNRRNGMTVETVDRFLYARHAIERNEHIAKINPKMPDGGSGMTTAEAQAVLAAIANDPAATAYEEIAEHIDAMRQWGIDERVNMGLMTEDEARMWRNTYQKYVPLKGWADTEHSDSHLDLSGIGRGLNVRGPETLHAYGRKTEAFSPLTAAITQAAEVVIRAEKNRVGQTMLALAEDMPEPNLWKVKKVEMVRVYNESTGLVQEVAKSPITLLQSQDELAVKRDGQEYRIVFTDPRLARAATKVGVEQLGAVGHVMSKFSRYFSATRTMLNPAFIPVNFMRDIITANINVLAKDKGGRIAAGMMKDLPRALGGTFANIVGGKRDGTWSRYMEEFAEDGGRVSFWMIETPDAARSKIEKRIAIEGGGALGVARGLITPSIELNPALHFIENFNLAVDNGVRLAAYVNARKQGYSRPQAASLAKNLTVNFNRRGEWGSTINAWWTFSNAGIQGTHMLLRSMKDSWRVRLVVIGMMIGGYLMNELNTYLSEEDEDEMLAYDKLTDYTHMRNLVIMMGGRYSADNGFNIFLPYGYNVFPFAGNRLSMARRGVITPEEAFSQTMLTAFESFSPISGQTAMQMVAPTILDPFAELVENQNFAGNPIMPDYDWMDRNGIPQSDRYFGSASDLSILMASKLNAWTGGTYAESGYVDVSPEAIDHIGAFLTGGTGTFIGRSADLFGKLMRGDDVERNDIPIYRKLFSDTYDGLDRNLYYERRDAVVAARATAKRYEDSGDPVPDDVRWVADLYDVQRRAEKMRDDGDPEGAYLLLNRAYNRAWADNTPYTNESLFDRLLQ